MKLIKIVLNWELKIWQNFFSSICVCLYELKMLMIENAKIKDWMVEMFSK
jgi:hypothetical protein